MGPLVGNQAPLDPYFPLAHAGPSCLVESVWAGRHGAGRAACACTASVSACTSYADAGPVSASSVPTPAPVKLIQLISMGSMCEILTTHRKCTGLMLCKNMKPKDRQ